jgi:putative glutamine amidotransferase
MPLIGALPGLSREGAGNDEVRAYVGTKYMQCVLGAGGLPMAVAPGSPPAEVYRRVDGLLLVGGKDIDPKHYGQDAVGETDKDPLDRFAYERGLLEQRPRDMPVLGVCYGCQAINVAAGGSLVQHIEGHEDGAEVRVRIEPGTKLALSVGAEAAEVACYHHQVVKELGEGLRASAHDANGNIEAIESTGAAWVVGVQWHPERTAGSEASQRLFRSFVEACARYREQEDACGTW